MYFYLSDLNILNVDFLDKYSSNCKLIFPEIFLVTSILILIIYGSLLSSVIKFNFPLINKTISGFVVMIFILLGILFSNSYCFYNQELKVNNYGFNNTLIFDDLAFYLKITILIFSIICVLIIQNYVFKYKINAFEYFILILLSVLGLFLLCSAFDFMTIYLAIELQSLSFYILAAFKRDSSYSTEAGLKYFILGSFSSGLLLFGVSILYGFLGTTNLGDIHQLLVFSGQNTLYPLTNDISSFSKIYEHAAENSSILKVGLYDYLNSSPNQFFNTFCLEELKYYIVTNITYSFNIFLQTNYGSNQIFNEHLLIVLSMFFIISALFFKIAAAPYHMWVPDVYEGSPTSSTVIFAVLPKLVLMSLLFRIFYYSFGDFFSYIKNLVAIVAVVSVLVGSLTALRQKKIKRLLAFSSVSHVGYLLLAVCTFSSSIPESVFFYLIIYMLTSVGVWSFVLINEPNKSNLYTSRNLSDVSGLLNINLTLTLSFILILFSLAGIPPLAGFYAKLVIFFNVVKQDYLLLAIIGVLSSAISAYYYLRIIKIMCFDSKIASNILFIHTIDYQKSFVLGCSVFSLIILFIDPNLLYLLCYKISFSL